MHVLSTDRLVLRQLTLDDAAFILKLVNDPAWLRHIGDKGVDTLDDARAYITQGPIASYRRYGFGLHLVQLKDTQPIGVCGLLKRDFLGFADLGFALLPEFTGHGYAYEAAAAVLRDANDTPGIGRVTGITAPDNHRSIKLLRKLGMHFQETIHWPDDGSQADLYIQRAPSESG